MSHEPDVDEPAAQRQTAARSSRADRGRVPRRGGTLAALAALRAAVGRDLRRAVSAGRDWAAGRLRNGRAQRSLRVPGRWLAATGKTGRAARANAARWVSRRPRLSRGGRRVILGLAILSGLGAAAVIGSLYWALRDVPVGEILAKTSEPTLVLEASDGAKLVQKGPFRREFVPLDRFPDHLVQAVLSIEDRRFYDHGGIDLRAIARASMRNLAAGGVVQGGSTITQQLVKILHLSHERTYRRKIREAFLALMLERRLDKTEILARYLNNIYLGAGATGVPAAALIYFDKDVSELTLSESALLAGLIRAPSQLNPLQNLDGARQRADLVLQAMVDAGYLEQARAAQVAEAFAELNPTKPELGIGSWFADWVIEEAREVAGSMRDAVTVRTTLVPELQALAESVVGRLLDRHGPQFAAGEAALVAMRPDGAVLAMVGGRDYQASQFNRAVQAKRQPGSTFKTFVYYAALRAGISARDRVVDEAVDIEGYNPQNFSGKFAGRVTVAEAFARSLNAATVKLALQVGLDNVVQAARDLGLDAELAPMPSLALGASEVTLLDLTGAYASLIAGYAPVQPWGIEKIALGPQGPSFRVGPAAAAAQPLPPARDEMIALLRLAVERGTGKRAQLDGFAAGKTGTSEEFRDAWFVGFTEHLVVGVWVGNDDSGPMNGLTGGELPAQIWQEFVAEASPLLAPAGRPAQPPAAIAGTDRGGDGEVEGRAATRAAAASATPICNIRACARAYRSFRVSDCTFQPYRGRRRLCEK